MVCSDVTFAFGGVVGGVKSAIAWVLPVIAVLAGCSQRPAALPEGPASGGASAVAMPEAGSGGGDLAAGAGARAGSNSGGASGAAGQSGADHDGGGVQIGPEDPGNEPLKPRPSDVVTITQCERPANIIAGGPFKLVLEWEWVGPAESEVALPLVANLTDDNGDGAIDTGDTPDVVVKAQLGGFMVVLDGASGDVHSMFPAYGPYGSFPALGDVNGDGVVEIVGHDEVNGIVAVDVDGAIVWRAPPDPLTGTGTITLADLDQDGRAETLSNGVVLSSEGDTLHIISNDGSYAPPLAADLDGDGALEVVYGSGGFRADGAPYFEGFPGLVGPQIADFEFDGVPEILLTGVHSMIVLEHDGTLRSEASVHDPNEEDDFALGPAMLGYVDGDAELDIALLSNVWLSVYRSGDLGRMWRAPISYGAYVYGITGFDFDGSATTEIVYADSDRLRIFDGNNGGEIAGYDLPGSGAIGYPIIADVDNDGSAEIVVAVRLAGGAGSRVMVFGAAQGQSFMPARRIWNQYHYAVTNIEEDGTFRTPMPRWWMLTNTFRVQSAITESGELCSIGTRANGETR